ncbi:MAG TPA: glycosyltransferase family 2 protein [Solirubrobacteraceae bacterium]|nr:glycosyltransferase family 2 protein [Solirubrobacteraceae bacterium]
MTPSAFEDTLVVVPAYNEERSIGAVVGALVTRCYEVCVIDDGSTDETAARAELAGANVIAHPATLGRGRALRTGFAYALGRSFHRVAVVDGDGQHDVRDVAALLYCMEETDSDFVIGSRFIHPAGTYEISAFRRLAMRVVTSRVSSATGADLTDSTSGFCAVRSPLLNQFAISYPTTFLAQTAGVLTKTHLSGWRVSETAVRMSRRRYGKPKTGPIKSAWYLLAVLLRIEIVYWHHVLRSRDPTSAYQQPMPAAAANDQFTYQARTSTTIG